MLEVTWMDKTKSFLPPSRFRGRGVLSRLICLATEVFLKLWQAANQFLNLFLDLDSHQFITLKLYCFI